MPIDYWTEVDLPVLLRVAAVAEEHPGSRTINPKNVQDRIEQPLPYEEFVGSLRRLSDGGYLQATLHRGGNGVTQVISLSQLTEKGLREVGSWPTQDSYASLLATLTELEEHEPNEEARSRLGRLRAAVGDVGKEVVTEALSRAISRTTSGW